MGLNRVYELGRPVVLNTLRFPLSVIRTFGKEWYKISNASIPTVLMNGSQLGYISQSNNWKVKEGQKVAILGLGGLGHMGVKFAAAFGAKCLILLLRQTEMAKKLATHHFGKSVTKIE